MKPITDDVVHALIRGVAAREKTKPASRTTAEIIDFSANRPSVAPPRLAVRPTVSGVFCYVARLRST
jgi:hypothetical protein